MGRTLSRKLLTFKTWLKYFLTKSTADFEQQVISFPNNGFSLYYYDNKKAGEVDYLIDDSINLSTTLLEIKSGKDYKEHSALHRFLSNPDYRIKQAFILSNERNVYAENGITYLPVYYVMFFQFDFEAVETYF